MSLFYRPTAGSAIPASVTNRWPMDEGSGSTLGDDQGSQSASLVGGSWESDSQAVGGYRTSYGGTDGYWETDSAFGVNGQEYTGMTWIRLPTIESTRHWLAAEDGNGRNGWAIGTDGNNDLRLVHTTSTFQVATTVSVSLSTDTWYFVAAAGNGDSGTLYIYDNNQLLNSGSGSASRTQQDNPLEGMRKKDSGDFTTGKQDAPAVSTTTEMTQTEIEDYWKATQR